MIIAAGQKAAVGTYFRTTIQNVNKYIFLVFTLMTRNFVIFRDIEKLTGSMLTLEIF